MAVKAGDGNEDMMAEINITPFTDVLLVLLIIFMIAATAVMQHGFNINLPKATTQVQADDDSNIIVSVNKDGGITVGTQAVTEDSLLGFLQRLRREKHDTSRVIIMGDTVVPYGRVVAVMDKAKAAGLVQISLAKKPE
ncbi:MAG: biopolymer transporter ExbD [Armatimonadetes bacterium]|nr:biopolymer transporter ExbD [Armatimonadota bacterium]